MIITFILHFKKENNKNLSKNIEFFANEILNFFGQTYGKLDKYYSDEYIIKKSKEFDNCFFKFIFEHNSEFPINFRIQFYKNSYYFEFDLSGEYFIFLGNNKEEIQKKLINFGKNLMNNFSLIEAFTFYNYYGLPNDLETQLEDLVKVKDQVNFILLKDGNNIKFIKGNTDIYGEDEI